MSENIGGKFRMHAYFSSLQVFSVATSRLNDSTNEPKSPATSPTQIQKVSLVKLAPLEKKTDASKTSRKWLTRL